jgi:hypothetical protein
MAPLTTVNRCGLPLVGCARWSYVLISKNDVTEGKIRDFSAPS